MSDRTAWAAATSDPFLDGARTGSLAGEVLDRWLEQDRTFVATLADAWRLMRASAPAEDRALLDEGIAAFDAEVTWFDELATTRRLVVPTPSLRVTAAYCDELLRVAQEPYAVALAAMWTVEAAYLEAWRGALPGAPAFRELVEHWTDPSFVAFVDSLERAADRSLAGATVDDLDRVRVAVLRILEHEAAFWSMTSAG